MASSGIKLANPPQGLTMLAVQGGVFHLLPSLQPDPGCPAKFAQLYIIDNYVQVAKRLEVRWWVGCASACLPPPLPPAHPHMHACARCSTAATQALNIDPGSNTGGVNETTLGDLQRMLHDENRSVQRRVCYDHQQGAGADL